MLLHEDMKKKPFNLFMDPIISFALKQTVHGFCARRFSVKQKHIVIQIKVVRFLNSNLKINYDFAC